MLVLGFTIAVAFLASTLGGLVLLRSPKHPAHVLFALGIWVTAAETLAAAIGRPEVSGASCVEWQRTRFAIASLIPAPWIAFSRLYSRGDLAQALRRWRRAWIALAIVPFLGSLLLWDHLVVLVPSPATVDQDYRTQLALAGLALVLFLLLTSVAVLAQIERTFRVSVGVMRWRIKYLVLGISALFGFRLFATSQAVLHSSPTDVTGPGGAAALLVASVLIAVALARDRAFTVDLYPSHSLVYRSVAVVLTGTYLVAVGLLSKALKVLGEPGGLPLRAFLILLALAGLAVFLLSERMRDRLRNFVSRHLRRPTRDYREVWRTFTAETTSLVEEGAYCRAVINWVSSTFQALSASVWLIEEHGNRLRLGGSTLLADSTASKIELSGAEVIDAVSALSRLHGPVSLDVDNHPWAETLKRLHPAVFPESGNRIGLPLESGGRLVGVMTLGDRVRATPFSTEDLELLKCIGDQVAAGLHGIRLSGQLVQAKELEAFQAMSTFFIHDLKNTASTLTLTLQNLQHHFGDPAFRDDALRAVRKSVQHLNELITRLGRLRQGLRVEPVPTHLSEVVDSSLATLAPTRTLLLENTAEDLPPIPLDSEQIQRVLVNLVLNAFDASPADSPVTLRISRENAWAVVEVSDRGSGMSPEFLRDSLFKPFQTTKSNGLGIGMFHSKMIVEAHQGRLTVESTQGKGTTFRVLLPLISAS